MADCTMRPGLVLRPRLLLTTGWGLGVQQQQAPIAYQRSSRLQRLLGGEGSSASSSSLERRPRPPNTQEMSVLSRFCSKSDCVRDSARHAVGPRAILPCLPDSLDAVEASLRGGDSKSEDSVSKYSRIPPYHIRNGVRDSFSTFVVVDG